MAYGKYNCNLANYKNLSKVCFSVSLVEDKIKIDLNLEWVKIDWIQIITYNCDNGTLITFLKSILFSHQGEGI